MCPVRANDSAVSSTFTLVSSVPITFDWNSTSLSDRYSGCSRSALRHPATHGLPRDFHAVTLKDLFLPVQRQMVEPLAHDHLCQQTGSGRALFDRLGWLGRRLHRAGTRVFFAHILDHRQLCWNEFVALTRLFPNGSQILLTDLAVLFRIRQIMHDALSLEVPRKWLPAAAPLLRSVACTRLYVLVIVVRALGCVCAFCGCLPRLPGCREQRQLIRGELLAFAVALGIQQLPQQTLDLVSLAELAIQLPH